ncbi:MAG: ShlB/FhaC/HecB family hemolysin secretion/activation protein [Rhodoferax sp.]|nr:ShlB/FhaC/HecB family hemolysin secretion/activation protein [Rhodoferax sp.]
MFFQTSATPANRKRWTSAAMSLSGALLLSTSAVAQQAMPAATGATTKFPINGFELTGDIPLKSEDTSRVLAPFIGPNGTLDTLQRATAALEAELKSKGYGLLRVSLPPQEVGNKVTLHIVKFVIGKVTVEGQSHYSEANIRASLPELREGDAPNFKTLAVQTAIANENPSKQVQVSLKESEEADKIDVKLLVKDVSPWNLTAGLSNTGSDATGKDRFSLVASHANVFGMDHQFSGAYTTSLERSSDVKQLGLNYRIPLYRMGGVVGASYTNSDVVGNFGSFNSTGAGQTFGLSYNQYLTPEGGYRGMVNLGLEDKVFKAGKINGILVPGQVDRGSRPVTLGYAGRMEADKYVWGYNAELSANVSGGEGNSLAAYQSEDPRIRNVNWKALRGGANYAMSFSSGWMWSLRGQFQYSPDALISGEQFGLGGATSIRGVGERATAGDSGLSTTFELTTPELHAGLRVVGFVDAGWLHSNNTDLNPNKPTSDQLASAGLGLRYTVGSFGLTAEWGQVVTGSTVLNGATAPKSGEEKLHVNLTARF